MLEEQHSFRELCGLQIPVHATTSDKANQISQIVLEYCRGHQTQTYIFILVVLLIAVETLITTADNVN